MTHSRTIPSFHWSSLILVALSYSIGWGIRGNFGHEFGAMLAGTLAGTAVALCSGREDWRDRWPFFAFFGALGCGFGGSMAYMPTMAYMQAEGAANQLYGFFSTFLQGALWTSLGGMGMAWAASEEREKLTAVFKPLSWVFVLWVLQYFGEDAFVQWYQSHVPGLAADASGFRQRSPLYWLDSEWVEATLALVALCAYDLWDRRSATLAWLGHWAGLAGLAAAGGLVGWLVQLVLAKAGLLPGLLAMCVHVQGDTTAINPATELPFDPAFMITNWPSICYDFADYMGAVFGAIAGVSVYFSLFGQFRSGAKLLVYITVGSYLAFIIGPVLLSNIPFLKAHGGLRLVSPRGDSWANTLGALLGALLYMARNKQMPVFLAGVVSFVLGGLSFITATFVKILAYMPGNPALNPDPETVQRWAHWRSANWHSICTEQLVGFLYGLSVAVALGLLASRVKSHSGEPRVRKWTEAYVVSFLLNVLLYVNMVKCIRDTWTTTQSGGFQNVPALMKAPLFGFELSATAWFNLMFVAITLCTIAMLVTHYRRPLALIPVSHTGKGQLFYLLFLWAIVLGNYMRALTGFNEQRLATEGMVMVNGLIVTFMITSLLRDQKSVFSGEPANYWPLVKKWAVGGVLAFLACTGIYETVDWSVYGFKEHGVKHNRRFGAQADWIVKPILKDKGHR